jgi:hypothetical protein
MRHCFHRSILLILAGTLYGSLATGAAAQGSPPCAAGASDTAFVLERAGIIPENIVYDVPRNRFLGGDLERDGLIELHRDGYSGVPFTRLRAKAAVYLLPR